MTGDQKPDYVFTKDSAPVSIFVWPGNGDGTFSAAAPITTTGFTGLASTTIFAGNGLTEATFLTDVTGDGIADLVHTTEDDGRTIAVWAGNGNGTFQTTPIKTSGFNNTGVGFTVFAGVASGENSFLQDVTGDGAADYVHVNDTGIFVWPGNGNGTFSTAAPTATTALTKPFASFAGVTGNKDGQLVDVTGDGRLDYVMTKDDEAANAGIYVWPGTGTGTFASAAIATRASGGLAAFASGFSAFDTSRVVPLVSQSFLPNGCAPAAPGGVAANLLLWNRGNSGIAVGDGQPVSRWGNVIDPAWSVTQAAAGSQPTYFSTTAASLLNFNPALRFDGLDQLFKSDVRLFNNTAGFHGIAVARDERTNRAELRGFLGMGDGNMPAFDLQTDGISPNGWNPFMAGSSPAEWTGGSALLFNGNTGGANRQPQLFALGTNNGGTDNIASAVDGFEEPTTLDANNQGSIGLWVWVGSSNGEFWLGLIGEAIVYSRRLGAGELRRVESYLAAKYGVTLRGPGGGAGDYVDSAGTTIWSGAANALFHNDVAVIAGNAASALDQRVSQSVDAGDQVAIASGSYDFAGVVTAQAPATPIGDASALAWGHNALATVINVDVTDPALLGAGVQQRMARVWRTQVTGVGLPPTVSIRIPATLIEAANPVLRTPRLLISTAADFSTGARAPVALVKTGAFYTATFSTFTPGELFTIGDGILPATLAKGFSDATLTIGSTTRLTWTLSNPDAAAQSGIGFTDTLPAGLVVATPANVASTCGGTVSAAGAVVSLAGGALAAGPGSCSIALDVTNAPASTSALACPAAPLTNGAANVSGLTTNLILAGGFGACVSLVASADVSAVKVAPAALVAGQTTDYAITVTNAGPSPAQAVVVTDTLPPELTFVTGSTGCTATGQTVSCTPGTLAAGQSVPLTLTVRVAPDVTSGSTLSNTVAVTSATPDPDPTDNTPPPVVSPPVTASADLSTAKSVVEATATPGATFTYRIVVANAGPSAAASVTVSDTLPAQATFVSSPQGCTAVGQIVSCGPVATLAAGASTTFDLVVRLDAAYTGNGSDVVNVATAASPTPDPAPANNTSPPAPAPAGPASADLTTAKSALASPLTPGGTFTYRIVVTNSGPSAATNVGVSDPLPAPLAFVSSPQGCTAVGQVVTCPPVASVAPGSSATFDLVARLDPAYTGTGSDIGNVATASSTTADPTPGNDASQPTTPPPVAAPSADLSATKSAVEPGVVPGATFTYRIVVANAGPSAAANVRVTDSLPAPLAFVSSPTGCTAVGRDVTCGPLAQLAPGASSTFDVVVRLDPAYTGNGSDIGNVATANSPTDDPDSANDSSPPAPPPPVGPPGADLATTKSALEAAVTPGATFTYRIAVTNNGPSTATAVTVSDPLPAALAFVSSPQGCTAAGQMVSCGPVATFGAGATTTFDVVVRLDPAYTGTGSDIQNVATAASSTDDPSPGNDASPPTGPPPVGAPSADLATAKSVVEATVTPGGTFTYRIVVTNAGPATAANVTVSDPLPAPLAFVSSPQGCTAMGQTVGCGPVASLAPGTSATFDVAVRLDPSYTGDGSDIQNVATASSPTDDPTPGNNSSPATSVPARPPSADLATTKTVLESSAIPGETFTYRVVVSNDGPSTAADVTVSDPLPAQVRFESSPSGCTAAGAVVTCGPVAQLLPGTQRTFDIAVRLDPAYSGDGGDIRNVATATSPTADPDPGDNTTPPAAPPPVGPPSADLATAKSAIEATVTPGETFTYRVVVTNAGPSTASGVAVSDALPAPLAFVSSPQGCTAAGQTVGCPVLDALAPGSSSTLELVVRLDPAYTGDGSDIQNVATATSATDDPNPGNDASPPAPAPPVEPPQADVQIVKNVSPDAVTPGTTFTYTLRATNNGPSVATGVLVGDALPVQTAFVSSAGGCTAVGQSVTCPIIPTLAVGQDASFDIVVRLDPGYTGDGTDVLNSATVTAATADPAPANDTSPAGAPPVGPGEADVTVVKDVGPDPVASGDTFTYTLLASNQGPSNASNLVVTDPLPPGLTFVSSPQGCTAAAQLVTCPAIATMIPGGSATFVLVVRLDPSYTGDGSDLPNRATVASDTGDPTPNNTSPPATPVVGPATADLTTTKSVLESVVTPGGIFTYRITVTNAGPSTATAVLVTDPLPSQMRFVSSPQGCTAAGQLVTCPLIATLAVGASTQLDLVVRLDPGYAGNGSDVRNTATATATTPDPDETDNTSPPASLPAVVSSSADLATTKSALETTVTPGQTFTYRIVVTNNGPSLAATVQVTDTLPAPLTFVSSPQGCAAAGRTVSCPDVPSLAVGGSATFDIVVRLDPAYTGDGSDLGNVATSVGFTPDPDPTNNASPPAPPPAVNPPSADVGSIKRIAEPAVTPGGAFTYLIVATNAGGSTATNVVITDTLPAAVAFVASPSGCTAAGQQVTCPVVPALPPAAVRSETIVARLDATYMGDGGDLPNVATVTAGTTDPNPADNTSPPVFPPVSPTVHSPSADLATTKLAVEATVTPGATITYRVTVTNHGPSAADNVLISDTLPASLTFMSSSQGCTAAGQVVTCPPVPALAAGASATFELITQLDPAYTGSGSDLGNVATATSSTPDPDPADNTTPVTPPPAVGPPQADLATAKTALEGAATPGEPFTYRITVTNQGPSLARNTVVGDTLPPSLAFVSSPQGCTAAGQTVTCPPVATLGAGASASTDLMVRLDPGYRGHGDDVRNIASARSDTADPNPANDRNAAPGAAAPPVGPARVDVAIGLRLAAGQPLPGSTLTLELTLRQLGPATATNVVATVTLPDGVTFAEAEGCTAAGQEVACPALASLLPAATATRTLDVRLGSVSAVAAAEPTAAGAAMQSQPLVVVARVTATEDDPVTANNTAELVLNATAEVCDNCVDDNGDGLVDIEDPECCTGSALTVTSARFRAPEARLRVTGTVADDPFTGLDPRRQDVRVQVRNAAGQLVCCTIPADRWQRLFARSFGFFDQKMNLCPNLRCVKLSLPKKTARATIIMGHVTPEMVASPLQITLSAGGQCTQGDVSLRSRKGGAIFP